MLETTRPFAWTLLSCGVCPPAGAQASVGSARVRHRKVAGDLLEAELVLVRREVETPRSYFLKARLRLVMVGLDELPRQREELRLLIPAIGSRLSEKVSDVEEHDNEIVAGTECPLLDWERAVAVRLVTALDLNANYFD